MEDKRMKTDVGIVDIIAMDVISKRLPAKSDIASCRSVCKEWRSALATPEFYRMYLENNKVTIDDYKLLVYDNTQPPDGPPFRTFSLNETIPPPLKRKPKGAPSIVASLDGLVCLAVSRHTLAFWNPFTDVCKKLSPVPRFLSAKATDPIGFYFDSFNNDYKLVLLPCNGYEGGAFVYSSRLDSWTDILISVPRCDELGYWSPATFYNQRLYFEVTSCASARVFSRIICFDVKTETFSEIPVPPLANATAATYYSSAGLVVLEERLHMYVCYNISDDEDGVDAWRMDDDGGKWEKVDSFTRQHQREQRICMETADNWLAVSDQNDNSFKKMSTEDFTTHYRHFSSALREYRFSRAIYAQTLVNP